MPLNDTVSINHYNSPAILVAGESVINFVEALI